MKLCFWDDLKAIYYVFLCKGLPIFPILLNFFVLISCSPSVCRDSQQNFLIKWKVLKFWVLCHNERESLVMTWLPIWFHRNDINSRCAVTWAQARPDDPWSLSQHGCLVMMTFERRHLLLWPKNVPKVHNAISTLNFLFYA